MDREDTTPTQVKLLRDIPYFGAAGEIRTLTAYQAAAWIRAGTAESAPANTQDE
jgi:hypothetical protein